MRTEIGKHLSDTLCAVALMVFGVVVLGMLSGCATPGLVHYDSQMKEVVLPVYWEVSEPGDDLCEPSVPIRMDREIFGTFPYKLAIVVLHNKINEIIEYLEEVR